MTVEFVRIADDSNSEPIEIPTEENGTLCLSSVSAQFPGVCGLKYRNPETQTMRGVKLLYGAFYPPETDDDNGGGSWKHFLFLTVYPKDNKRKMEDEDSQSVRSKRPAQKCSDLIVLGLPWKAEESDLENYFKSYGELVMKMIKRDNSGKSKGYGFIRYANYESQEQVLRKQHYIEGRRCEVKIPHSKEEPRGSNKIFVGRITESMTREDLRSYFEEFGDVDDVFIPAPFRSFAFVTFREIAIAQKLIGEDHVINGVSVYINNADPKGSKDQGRLSGPSLHNPPFHHGGRGGPPSDNSRYFAGGGRSNRGGSPSFDPRPPQQFTNPINQGSFSGGPSSFSTVNPAFLAAALESWNTVVTGMLAGAQGRSVANPGGGPGENWQNNDTKKDQRSSNWGGKGDAKWS